MIVINCTEVDGHLIEGTQNRNVRLDLDEGLHSAVSLQERDDVTDDTVHAMRPLVRERIGRALHTPSHCLQHVTESIWRRRQPFCREPERTLTVGIRFHGRPHPVGGKGGLKGPVTVVGVCLHSRRGEAAEKLWEVVAGRAAVVSRIFESDGKPILSDFFDRVRIHFKVVIERVRVAPHKIPLTFLQCL